MDAFDGAWVRTALHEPRSAPPSTDATLVVWLQACAAFVDVRGARAGGAALPAVDPRASKSFAGVTQWDGSVLTWCRAVDYRAVCAPPDAGVVTLRADGVLQEDSALPGDDYTELWTRAPAMAHAECGAGDAACDDVRDEPAPPPRAWLLDGPSGRSGTLVDVDGLVGLALGRQVHDGTEDALRSYFTGSDAGGDADVAGACAHEYVAFVAVGEDEGRTRRRTGVAHALRAFLPPSRRDARLPPLTVLVSTAPALVGTVLSAADGPSAAPAPTHSALAFGAWTVREERRGGGRGGAPPGGAAGGGPSPGAAALLGLLLRGPSN